MGPHDFDPEKATEALLYVASRVARNDLYKTLKVLYLADKCHLHKYGRLIFGDTHHALPHGPVPQGAYDLLKYAKDQPGGFEYPPLRAALRLRGNTIEPIRDADVEIFSKSDLECLDEAIEEFGRLSFNELKARTHDAAYNATGLGRAIALDAIAALSENPASLIQHLADPHPNRE